MRGENGSRYRGPFELTRLIIRVRSAKSQTAKLGPHIKIHHGCRGQVESVRWGSRCRPAQRVAVHFAPTAGLMPPTKTKNQPVSPVFSRRVDAHDGRNRGFPISSIAVWLHPARRTLSTSAISRPFLCSATHARSKIPKGSISVLGRSRSQVWQNLALPPDR